MNSHSVLIITLCSILISCNSSAPSIAPKEETPKALQDKGSLDEIKISRGREDLIETIYKELAAKDPALKSVEASITSVQERSFDSLKAFSDYNQKSEEYYTFAANYTSRIKDSVLRKKINEVIANSESAYNKRTSQHLNLITQINAKSAWLEDLHVLLKLSRTLAVIERYQKKNLPDTSSLQHLLREYEQIAHTTDSLVTLP